MAKAKNLKLAVTAGIGSDHVDLNAANKTNGGITVAEVTGSNVVSVAEHVIMTILLLVRNYNPAHEMIERGEWDVAAAAKQEYDLEGKSSVPLPSAASANVSFAASSLLTARSFSTMTTSL